MGTGALGVGGFKAKNSHDLHSARNSMETPAKNRPNSFAPRASGKPERVLHHPADVLQLAQEQNRLVLDNNVNNVKEHSSLPDGCPA